MMLKEGDLLVWRQLRAHIPDRMDISRPFRNSCGGVGVKHWVVSQSLQVMPLLEFIQIEFLDTGYSTLSVGKEWEWPQVVVAFSNSLLERKCWCHFIYINHNSLYHFEGIGNILDHPLTLLPALTCCHLAKLLCFLFSSRRFRIKSSEEQHFFCLILLDLKQFTKILDFTYFYICNYAFKKLF